MFLYFFRAILKRLHNLSQIKVPLLKFGFRSIQRCIRMHRLSEKWRIVFRVAAAIKQFIDIERGHIQTTMDLVDIVDISTATQWTCSPINNRRRRSADRLKNPVHIFEWDGIKSTRFIGGGI